MLVSLVCLLHCADMKQVLLVDQEGLRDRFKMQFYKAL